MTASDYDAIVIGSGFGGSVAGLRLVENGHRVLMVEQGRELQAADLPKTNWDLRRWLWLPAAGLRGFFSMRFLRHVTVLSGVAVGGGSVTYAATLPQPGSEFFTSGDWAELLDWERELAPHYETARRMLGVARNPNLGEADLALRKVAERRGEASKFSSTDVGVYFGQPGVTASDPYFDGAGPARTGCVHCGGCMLGCRFGAKNTLDKNYLHLARRQGLQLLPQTRATAVLPREGGGYWVEARGRGLRPRRHRWSADRVILAAGVLGTLELLLKMRKRPDGLPNLSPMLGRKVRTNSESFIGVISPEGDRDLSRGLAIGSIYHCAPGESVEPVRYSDGSGFFRLLMAPHVTGKTAAERLTRLLALCLRHPLRLLRAYTTANMARRMSILMYMRTCEGTLRFELGRWGLRSRREEGPAPVASFKEASQLAQQSAQELSGVPFSLLQETLFNIPTTAHVLGGAVIGSGPERGVLNSDQQVFGYPGLYVMDGSAMSANPGVNPSLTITAMAERASSLIVGRARGSSKPLLSAPVFGQSS